MVRIPKKVTVKMLKRRGASCRELDRFIKVFGDEVAVTIANIREAIKRKLGLQWFCWAFNFPKDTEFWNEKNRIRKKQSYSVNLDKAYGQALIWLLKQRGRS